MKKQVFIIDTSAILSGKPIRFENVSIVTTPGVSDELNPGGRDFRTFELLKGTGLAIHAPSKEAINRVKKTVQETGDDRRLSFADIEVVALAIDINKEPDKEATVLTDDYSIQNVSSILEIKFQGFSQNGITKKFKWVSRCPGCKRQFDKLTKICPICGTITKNSVIHKKNL
jgi:UPF0271 protein